MSCAQGAEVRDQKSEVRGQRREDNRGVVEVAAALVEAAETGSRRGGAVYAPGVSSVRGCAGATGAGAAALRLSAYAARCRHRRRVEGGVRRGSAGGRGRR